MATSSQEILRIRRTDLGSEHFFLVNVSQSGPKPLDLELVGTDRESVFPGNVKETTIESLQAANFSGGLDEWKSVLSYALLHQRPDGPLPESLQGVEAVAAISGTTVTITLRRNITGILQRLGTIKLEKDEDREIDVLDWVDAAAKSSDDLRSQLDTLQESVTSQKDQIAQLTASLDNLVRAKKEHENELLSKFAALLNAKKLKIRDQQRLLAGAQIDSDVAEQTREDRSPSVKPAASRGAAKSRKGKRKAEEVPAPVQQEDDETDAGTVDEEEEDGDRRQQLTPETETEDENENDLNGQADASGMVVEQDDSQRTRRIPTRQSQPVSNRMDVDDGPSHRLRGSQKAKEPTPPPTSTANNDDEDDETDDEL